MNSIFSSHRWTPVIPVILLFFIYQPVQATDQTAGGAESDSPPTSGVTSGDWRTRIEAIDRMMEEQKEQSIPSLLRLASQDPDTAVAAHAAMAAGSFGFAGENHEVTDAFLGIFDQRREPLVRYSILLSLVSLQDEDRSTQIRTALETARDESNDPMLKDLATKLVAKYNES